jgi:hypothetical protein
MVVKKELDAAGVQPALDVKKIGASFYRGATVNRERSRLRIDSRCPVGMSKPLASPPRRRAEKSSLKVILNRSALLILISLF